jgi:hypothetical protein
MEAYSFIYGSLEHDIESHFLQMSAGFLIQFYVDGTDVDRDVLDRACKYTWGHTFKEIFSGEISVR